MNALKTVTDRFSLVDKIRKFTPQNERKYAIDSVRETFNSPETKEAIALGEMYGYYGHGRRAMHYSKTKSLKLPEVSVVMVDGKPVVLDNVPSNRTLEASIDDSGIVTHTQEILDTDPGHIVRGMLQSDAGGWSWATHGPDGRVSLVRSFYGFDYVQNPNYISLDKKSLMLESPDMQDEMIHRALMEQGFSENAAIDLLAHFKGQSGTAMLEAQDQVNELEGMLLVRDAELHQLRAHLSEKNAMLESQDNASRQCRRVLKDALQGMPVFISTGQRKALCRMQGEDDARIVAAMLESLGASASNGLPVQGQRQRHSEAPPVKSTSKKDDILLFVPR